MRGDAGLDYSAMRPMQRMSTNSKVYPMTLIVYDAWGNLRWQTHVAVHGDRRKRAGSAILIHGQKLTFIPLLKELSVRGNPLKFGPSGRVIAYVFLLTIFIPFFPHGIILVSTLIYKTFNKSASGFMMIPLPKTCISALVALFAAGSISPAYADRDKDENGHGGHGRHKHEKREYKEEYWDGNCKVKRKLEKNGDYEEERKCKAPRHSQSRDYRQEHGTRVEQAVVMVQPPWIVVSGGEPAYRPGWEPVPVQQAQRPSSVSYCNSDTVGSVIGGIAGGLVGNQIGKGNGRTVALIGGAIAGTLIGGEIGRRMDAQNQACIGQALEFAPEGKQLSWQDSNRSDVQYAVVPGKIQQSGNIYCRPYTTTVVANGQQQKTDQIACRQPDGTWAASR
jgi:surface antigen